MIQTLPVPTGKTYLPYQEKGIRYALGARGTLLADEMGLGKTVQALGVLNAMPPASTALIVCPAGLRINWQNEIKEWLVGNRSANVISYHQAEEYSGLAHFVWDLLIIDEAHYIKNPNSKRSQAVVRLSEKAKRVILLTGTPIENSPVELWPLLRIVCPEHWDNPSLTSGHIPPDAKKSHPGEGPNFWAFARRYCGLKKTRFRVGQRYRSAWDFSGASNLDELNKKLKATCMVRRKKSEVLKELPPKIHQVIVLDGEADDSDLMPELNEDNYYECISKLQSVKIEFEEWSKRRHEQALKMLDSCIRFVEDALDQSDKILIFGHHTDVLARFFYAFEETGVKGMMVTGAMDVDVRQSKVKQFQEEKDCRLFVGSIGAAGVGYTLTAASHVIFIELDPVPGKMTQAIDRVHRIGQKAESILIQYLVMNGSLSARMAKILVKKERVINAAVG